MTQRMPLSLKTIAGVFPEDNKIRGFFEIRGYWKYLEFVTTLQQKRACVLDSKPFCVIGKYEECGGGI